MRPPLRAEDLLISLGVQAPSDIDLEAIAAYQGAMVKYRPLDGCEARIVGVGDRAIITVREGLLPARARFSLAHELGHWALHRGRSFICRSDDIGGGNNLNLMHPERQADAYAADLLLPDFLFKARLREFPRISMDVAAKLAGEFSVSLTATAIRLVEKGDEPAILVSHGRRGRRWFTRNPGVPDTWFPQVDLDHASLAFDVVFGEKQKTHMGKIGAETWFDRRDASRFEISEQTIRIADGEGLTLLLLNEEMLDTETASSGHYR